MPHTPRDLFYHAALWSLRGTVVYVTEPWAGRSARSSCISELPKFSSLFLLRCDREPSSTSFVGRNQYHDRRAQQSGYPRVAVPPRSARPQARTRSAYRLTRPRPVSKGKRYKTSLGDYTHENRRTPYLIKKSPSGLHAFPQSEDNRVPF